MVGFKVGPIFYRIGTGSFLYCFFSTIAYRLEDKKWGTRFPYLMNNLYNGHLSTKELVELEGELKIIKEELTSFEPQKIVWDLNNLSQKPPWGDNISEQITNLSNYFVTNDGKDLFDLFEKAINAANEVNKDIELKSLQKINGT